MTGWLLVFIWSALLVGVLLESIFDLTLLAVQLLCALALLAGIAWRRWGTVRMLVTSLVCFMALVGIIRTQWFEAQFADTTLITQVGQPVELVGIVATEPDKRATFTQLYLDTGSDRILVRADRFTDVSYGDELLVSGRIDRPQVFMTDTGRVFDYPKYLQVRGVQYVVSFAEVQVVSKGNGNWSLAQLYQVKQTFINVLSLAINSPQVDLGVGLLLGVKQALGDELETAFRQTGIIHIVVLSGYNVMLVVGFFWWLSSWVLPLRGRVVFGLVGITLFALLVGLSATVVRASIMAAVMLVGLWLGRPYDVLRALLFAAAVMVLINPYILLYDIGFQLSFMATLGLVLILPQFESTLATQARRLKLKDLFAATVVTQIFVLPLLMYHIGEVSLVSVLVNMLVLPVVPIAMILTFVTGLAGLLAVPLGALVGLIAYLPLQYIIYVAESFATLPFAVVVVPEISVWIVVSMYVVLGSIYWYWRYVKATSNQIALAPTGIDVSDWQIVEEGEDKKSGGVESSDSTPPDTPVFFR